MAPEFFWHRPARRVRPVCVVRGDFREFVTVGAPSALEREVVERKNHDAAAQIIVGDIDLIGRLVNSNFFDSSHDHRRRRRILLSEGRLLSGCLRRCLGLIAATAAAPAPPALRGGYSNESRNGSGAALARNTRRKRWRDERLALRRLGHVRDFSDNLAALRIVLANRVLADVPEPLGANDHAVTLRRLKGTD